MVETLRHAYAFLSRGGPVMLLIVPASVLCVALILERFRALGRERVLPKRLSAELLSLASERKVAELLSLARASDSPAARILASGLSDPARSKEDLKASLEIAGRREVSAMDRNVEFLAIIGTVSPLLGLFGTVTGMIKTFVVVRNLGLEDPLQLSGGIAEALITTAAGLAVAIPALVFHRYFSGRIERFVLDMEELADRILVGLKGE